MMMGVRCGCAEERRRPSSNAVWAACPAACASEPQNGNTVRPVNGTLLCPQTRFSRKPANRVFTLAAAAPRLAPARRPSEDNTTAARFNQKSPTIDILSMYFHMSGRLTTYLHSRLTRDCAEDCVGRLANTNRISAPWQIHSWPDLCSGHPRFEVPSQVAALDSRLWIASFAMDYDREHYMRTVCNTGKNRVKFSSFFAAHLVLILLLLRAGRKSCPKT